MTCSDELVQRVSKLEERVTKLEDTVRALTDLLTALWRVLDFEPCPYRTCTTFIDKERNCITIRIVPFCTAEQKTCEYSRKDMCPVLRGRKGRS